MSPIALAFRLRNYRARLGLNGYGQLLPRFDPVQELGGKVFKVARASAWPALGSRMSLANFSSSSAAAAAVRAEVPVVKQIGWPVSASIAKKV